MRILICISVLAMSVCSGSRTACWPRTENNRSLVRGKIRVLNEPSNQTASAADLSGAAVWLIPTHDIAQQRGSTPVRARMEQRDKRFVPHVMVIQVGTEVDFPNDDPFFHNVFSVYNGKTFDLGLYAKGESRPVRFNRPGISYIYCNIHPQMSAVIVTVDSPYFAESTSDGTYSIKDVPMGTYELHLWHERSDDRELAAQTRRVKLDSAVVDLGIFELDETGYIPRTHKNKYGEEYNIGPDRPAYRHP